MDNKIRQKASEISNNRRYTKRWQKVVSVVCAITILGTSYALILPAVTEQAQTYCGFEEHVHSDECYREETILACSYDETHHAHSDACYEEQQVLSCGLEENAGHTHNDSCYGEDGSVVCGLEETEEHTHSDSCYKTERVLICGMEEAAEQPHEHTEECYRTERTLVCEKQEHQHTLECFSNPLADLESSEVWERSFRRVKLSGIWADDVLAIADTQLGYTESDSNYIVEDDGMTTRGYTRYGDWYGDPYGDWSAMFCAFCLNYAGVDEEHMPWESDCQRWVEKLQQVGLYRSAGSYEPKPGDLIFFDEDTDGISDHVGFLSSISNGQLNTIEGGRTSTVSTFEYNTQDPTIAGCGSIPLNPNYGGEKQTKFKVEKENPACIESEPAEDGAVAVISGDLPEDAVAEIHVVTLTEEELAQYLGEDRVADVTAYVSYDIKILLPDGEEWQPGENETVNVRIKHPNLPEEEPNHVAVAHVDSETGEASTIKPELNESGELAFETDGFSLYILYTYTVDYHYNGIDFSMDGESTILLSQLFAELGIDRSAADVVDLVFTDPTLLAVASVYDETTGILTDWKLTSLLPFSTNEILTVTFADGEVITIEVTDAAYPAYTFDSRFTPYEGSFEYVNGHYKLFGAGNGLPIGDQANCPGSTPFTFEQTGSWGGTYKFDESHFSGTGAGEFSNNSAAVGPGANMINRASTANVSWSGTLKRAFFSIAFYVPTSGDSLNCYFELENFTDHANRARFTFDGSSMVTDPNRSNFSASKGWLYFTFDATDFLNQYGPGDYHVYARLTKTNADSNPQVADIGFTVYGISESPSFPLSSVCGTIGEYAINAINSASVSFNDLYLCSGATQIWFNCHGGELSHPRAGMDGRGDCDSLLITSMENGKEKDLYIGTGGDIPITGVVYDDIACPNHNQTPMTGKTAYDNRDSFGLYSTEALNGKVIIGAKKTQESGSDVFGSLMICSEVYPATSDGVVVIKDLDFDGSGVATGLSAGAAAEEFEFTLTPLKAKDLDGTVRTDLSPLNINAQNGVIKKTAKFAEGDGTGTCLSVDFGTFGFKEEGIYSYEIKETSGSAANWEYSSDTLLLTFTVTYDSASARLISQPNIVNLNNSAKQMFTNKYTVPISLNITKKNTSGNSLANAKFMLYENEACTTAAVCYKDSACTSVCSEQNAPTSNSSGLAVFYGLDSSKTYYLKELEPPVGYRKLNSPVKIWYDSTQKVWRYEDFNKTNHAPQLFEATYENDWSVLPLEVENVPTASLTVTKNVTSGNTTASFPFEVTLKNAAGDPVLLTAGTYTPAGSVSYTVAADGKITFSLKHQQSLILKDLPEGLSATVTETGHDGYSTLVMEGNVQLSSSDKVTDLALDTDRTITYYNNPGTTLPKTGGIGTDVFIWAGLTTILIGFLFAFRQKRRPERRMNR